MSNLRGTLESIALTDVAQLLHVNRKTGMLQVTSGKTSGVLYFSNGEVIHAETVAGRGETAAFEILEWVSGHFEFLGTQIQVPASIRRTVPDLLMDSARLQDSRRRLHTIFPRLTAVPWPTMRPPQLLEGIKVFAEDRRIMPFFDGYRDFQDVMAATGQNDVAVLQAASLLKDAGRLEVLEPDAHVTVAELKTGLFKKADHLGLPKAMEGWWTVLGPYRHGVANVRVIWPKGPAVERVEFLPGLPEKHVAIPRELMQGWGLSEGAHVKVRPAP
ncbi:DUF4388 domain-containing protein [Geothrix edaphica]|uniref:PatA-like N-terminal domain-containing protein n=1 Tax=Geothrix edaphica TaxID=2927976 RepID=A0ABQ5PWW1_9BACT|nr:DUF4388 domain-containing protein [Geothrix edaphica]GLH66858.1 hypothetical protein GETHED_12220 [Geothrix edaphica]